MHAKNEFEARKELLNLLLKDCWKLDIVTVIATGNRGHISDHYLKDEIPACLGQRTNPLITVGAATVDGKRFEATSLEKGVGSISVWAKGDMPTYCAATEGTGSEKQHGSSMATAQVSGLAAYFLSLSRAELLTPKGWSSNGAISSLYKLGPDLHVKGKVAQTVKDYIVAMSHVRTEVGVNMAYSGAEDGICEVVEAASIALKRAPAPKKDAYGLTPFIVSGKFVGTSSLDICTHSLTG